MEGSAVLRDCGSDLLPRVFFLIIRFAVVAAPDGAAEVNDFRALLLSGVLLPLYCTLAGGFSAA